MKFFGVVFAVMMAWAFGGSAWGQFVTPPHDLRVESQVNPLAIEAVAPRFSWQFASPAAGDTQTAYRILVASKRELLATPDLWDSGKIASDETVQIPYAGKPLTASTHAFWAVTVWNRAGQALSPIDPAEFTMGLLDAGDWQARWIQFPGDDADKKNEAPPLFRRDFSLGKPIARALVHVCGLGQYELSINGKKVGDWVLTPAWTLYSKTCDYDTYDVTAQLQQGNNAMGIMLGNGMYNVLRLPKRYTKFPLANDPNPSFGVPKVILQLAIDYADGTHERVITDDTWKTARGPITTSQEYGGEDYDARREFSGWNLPGFTNAAWQAAAISAAPGEGHAQLVADSTPLSKIAKIYPAVKITEPRPGVFVYDFGQNLSGWPMLRASGPAGTVIKLTPGELLDQNGAVSQGSSGGPMWFSYTLKGDPNPNGEEWHPRFSYYGYRYVQVEGAAPAAAEHADIPGKIIDLSSEFVHADLRTVGSFTSSDQTLNQIHTLIDNAIWSNVQSLMTDCPHREKLGWLEQTHLMGDAVAMNYDISGLYPKMCRDMRDSQTATGLVPDIAPEYTVFPGGFRDSPEWGSAAVIDPWMLFQYYGDTRTLAAQYDAMKKYVAYLGTQAKEDILANGLGDWYDIGPAKRGKAQLTSLKLTATAIYFYDLDILSKMAVVLHQDAEGEKYRALAAEVRAAFNKNFYNAKMGDYEKGSQTADAMPVALGLVDAANETPLVEKLAAAIRANGNRVTAGDVGFSYVVKTLTDFDQGDVMYGMMTQSDGPGYVDQLKKGATTLTEAWDAAASSSQNHLMLGHAEAWLYRGLAGIQNAPDSIAFKRIVIHPQFVEGLAAVDGKATVYATYNSPRGIIESGWTREGKKITLTVTIPPTTMATVWLPPAPAKTRITSNFSNLVKELPAPPQAPGATRYEVPSGTYTFECTLP